MDFSLLNSSELSLDDLSVPSGNRLIFDWVSLSTKIHKPEDIISLLGMEDCPWEILSGFYGYNLRHFFGGVSIHFCEGDMSRVNGFYLLEMSGQGCRTFETYGHGNYDVLFNFVRSEFLRPESDRRVRLTRLDVAYDDLTGVLDLEQMLDYADNHYFVSRFASRNIEELSSPGINGRIAKGLNCGSKANGLTYIRVYNKALERGFDEKACNKLGITYPFHWVRCEVQLRKDNATGFIKKLSGSSLSELYTGVLRNYLSFREPNSSDSNIRRWEEASWWTTFLDNAAAISVVDKPGVKYNLSALTNYVLTQPIGSLKTIIKLFGEDALIQLIKSAPDSKNPKYKRLIAEVEHERSCSESLPDEQYIDLPSDSVLDDLKDLQDEIREDMSSISRDSRDKSEAYRKKNEARKSASYLRSQGIDPLSDVKKKIKPGSFAEEYLKKRGFNLK